MGQARAKQNRINKYANLTLEKELQKRLDDMVLAGQGILANHFAEWKLLQLPDGETVIAFVLPQKYWTLAHNRIILDVKRDE